MDNFFDNSFYYFFSATPQVLGGILALFGVLVIFKLQSLTTELLSTGVEIKKILQMNLNESESDESLNDRVEATPKIVRAILIRNLKDLKQAIDKITVYKQSDFLNAKYRFNSLFDIYSDLLTITIQSSIFTGIVIIFCLSLLPFGHWVCCSPAILFIAFLITLLSIIYIFYKLFLVLRKSIL